MSNYELTIIMSNYNQASLLQKALDSALAQQTLFEFKIIIVDDHSTKDNSIDVISRIEKENYNVHAIFGDKNEGYLANILRAKKITTTKYFCLLDADDYWTDINWLQKAYDFLENNPEYVIYESNVMVMSDDNPNKKWPFISKKIKTISFDKQDLYSRKNVPISQTTGQFYRNVIFCNGVPQIMIDAIGNVSERSFEGDEDRFIMHLKYGKAFYKDEMVGVYRWSNNGIWAHLKGFEKELIKARCYMDYYCFYNENIEFFVSESWKHLNVCLLELVNEIDLLKDCDYSLLKYHDCLKSVYEFCQINKFHINSKTKKIEKIKYVFKLIVKIIME